MNAAFTMLAFGIGSIATLSQFGTGVAMHDPSPGMAQGSGKRNTTMSISNVNHAFAAVFAFAVSALFMATAIVPASPAGFVA